MNTTRRINTKTNIFLKTKINRQKKNKNSNISNNNKNNKILRRQESQNFLIMHKKTIYNYNYNTNM